MGFSTIAASIVLFIGFLFFGSMVTNALFEEQREATRALEENRDRAEFRGDSNSTLRNGSWSSGVLHLNITNTGLTVMDASLIELLIDGVWSTDEITSKTIGGVATNVWAQGEHLYVKADAASEPARAIVILETGKGLVWTS